MVEPIDFLKYKKKEDAEKPREKRGSLFFTLSEQGQLRVQKLLDIVKNSRQSGMQIEQAKIDEGREIVKDWTTQEVIAFLENQENENELMQKPHFTMALLSRIFE